MTTGRFYRVAEPVRVWRQVGHSESNVWKGSSRLVNTVRHAVNLRKGDELHAYASGYLCVARGDERWIVSLMEPAPFLQRRSMPERSGDVAAQLAAAGLLTEIAAPEMDGRLGETLEAVRANRLDPLSPETVEVEPSPEMETLASEVRDALGPWADAGLRLTLSLRDSGHAGPASATLTTPLATVTVQSWADGRSRTHVPEGLPFDHALSFRGDGVSYADTCGAGRRAALEAAFAGLAALQGLSPPARGPGA